jgi:predicted signal transduction protein with EAL and GGDEF domain
MGISIFPDHGEEVEALLKNADLAMYKAKENGRNNFQLFTLEMNVQAVERMTLENGLRRALEREELFLVYHPRRTWPQARSQDARRLSAGGIRSWDSYRPTSSSQLQRIAV